VNLGQGKPERFLNTVLTPGETLSYIVPAGCIATVLGAAFVVTPPLDTDNQFYLSVGGQQIAVVTLLTASEQTPLQYEWLGLGPLAFETEEITISMTDVVVEGQMTGQVWGKLYSGFSPTT
jgi:hypothetical protein